MRIISGQFRGKRLLAPDGRGTRPTSDKVRESIFDILSSRVHTGGKVLDLFAGTGALGIEAISRGAEKAVFVEKNPEAAAVARKNLASLGIGTNTARVYNTDWKVAVRKLEGARFDVIFLDPPYAAKEERRLLDAIIEKDLLAEGGCIVVEHAAANAFDCDGFDADRRRYSDTAVTFLRPKRKKPLCVFPGAFNPFTLGHLDVVNKALRDYEKVIVAVAEIIYKDGAPPCGTRAEIADKAISKTEGAEVRTFDGMLTDYLTQLGCFDVVRGIRNETDRAYEKNIAEVYKKSEPRVSIAYYDADLPLISSHEVRRLIENGETDKLDKYVCPGTKDDIVRVYGKV